MNIREIRQQEAVDAFLATSDRKSIINACPRFGKIRVALKILREMKVTHVWVMAPRKDIFKGWDDEFRNMSYQSQIVGRFTFASIKKLKALPLPEMIILDEPHELSVNQQIMLAERLKGADIPILGLTGTLTQKTRNELYDSLNLDVCYKYSIDQGVKDGIITDYQLIIHQVPLDNTVYKYGSAKKHTEKKWFDITSYLKDDTRNPKTRNMMKLRLINIIQNSTAKLLKTRDLLDDFHYDRVLVFCGVTQIADSLSIPVYHSKAKEKNILLDFCTGAGGINQLATIKMMQAGVTINPIHKGIINYMSGNPEDSAQKICRFLGFEYDNPGKKAEIHIISTDEGFETERLKTGLAFFDKSKISIIKH